MHQIASHIGNDPLCFFVGCNLTINWRCPAWHDALIRTTRKEIQKPQNICTNVMIPRETSSFTPWWEIKSVNDNKQCHQKNYRYFRKILFSLQRNHRNQQRNLLTKLPLLCKEIETNQKELITGIDTHDFADFLRVARAGVVPGWALWPCNIGAGIIVSWVFSVRTHETAWETYQANACCVLWTCIFPLKEHSIERDICVFLFKVSANSCRHRYVYTEW